jgi:2-polyprenyl-6-methoxyphenol hydroxylase-like FAD-dependent oxidoreductase
MPEMTETKFDLGIIGGGPAGAVAALQLASFGRRVYLLERSISRPHVGESLSSGIWPILDSLGLTRNIVGQKFFTPRETWICWDSPKLLCRPERPMLWWIGRNSIWCSSRPLDGPV